MLIHMFGVHQTTSCVMILKLLMGNLIGHVPSSSSPFQGWFEDSQTSERRTAFKKATS